MEWGLIVNSIAIVGALWGTYSAMKTRLAVMESQLIKMESTLEKIEQRMWDFKSNPGQGDGMSKVPK